MTIILAARHLLPAISEAAAERGHDGVWVKDAAAFVNYPDADLFIDFDFDGRFFSPSNKPLLINETMGTFAELHNHPEHTARFCGWPGFYDRQIWEVAIAAGASDKNPAWLLPCMSAIGKQYKLTEDQPGFIAPRIVSMIINEALYCIAENVSSTEQIDTAMKLGTNYPDGPFAWLQRIGYSSVYSLLKKLEQMNHLYEPHPLIKKP